MAAVVVENNQAQGIRSGHGVQTGVVRGHHVVADRTDQGVGGDNVSGVGANGQAEIKIEVGGLGARLGIPGAHQISGAGHEVGNPIDNQEVVQDELVIGRIVIISPVVSGVGIGHGVDKNHTAAVGGGKQGL